MSGFTPHPVKVSSMKPTPDSDATVPLNTPLLEEEIRVKCLHYFFNGIELNDMGKATRIVDWEKVWNAFDGNYATDGKVPGNVPKLQLKPMKRLGECGLEPDGNFIHFPLFRLGTLCDTGCADEDVIEVVLIPRPEVMDKKFFEKMSQLVVAACGSDNSSWADGDMTWACEWDLYTFMENIVKPNKAHIQLVMGLSDELTERVVHSINYAIVQWNEDAYDDECEMKFHEAYFTDEDYDF